MQALWRNKNDKKNSSMIVCVCYLGMFFGIACMFCIAIHFVRLCYLCSMKNAGIGEKELFLFDF